MSKLPHKAEPIDSLAALLTATLLLVVVSTIRLIPSDPMHLVALFTIEHIQLLDMFDSRGQQWAHRILVILLSMLGIGLWLARPLRIPARLPSYVLSSMRALSTYGGLLITTSLAAFVFFRLANPPASTYLAFQGRYPLSILLSTRTHLILLVLGLLAAHASVSAARVNGQFATNARRVAVCSVAIYVVALVCLGILWRPDFSGFSPGLLAGVEWHYSGSVGSADRLAAGDRLGEVSLHSGLLPSVMLGISQKAFGMLDFASHIRLIAALQSFALAVAILGYGVWYTGRATPWILATLLVLPWMQPLHAAVLYPNQSAWRFLALCFGVVILVVVDRRQLRLQAAFLGFVGGVAVFWNPETGLCLCLSYLVYMILEASETSSARPMAWPLLRFFIGLCVAILGVLCLVRAGLGYWPDVPALFKSFPLISGFAKGYGGLRFKHIDPLAALILVHALYHLIQGLLKWATRVPLGPRDNCRTALAAAVVLWAAYYFKGPDPWNLWSFLFLYGFLVGSLLPATHLTDSPFWTLRRFLGSSGLAALGVIVLPSLLAMNAITLRSAELVARQPACPTANLISGVCMPAEVARALTQKAASLREQFDRSSLLYFSADSYLMPVMTGVVQPLRERDPFSESILKADFDGLVRQILALRPRCTLFDDPNSPLSGYDSHRSFYRRLRAAITPVYALEQFRGGWEAWCLKPD